MDNNPLRSVIRKGDAVGIIACSDGRHADSSIIQKLATALSGLGLEVKLASTLYREGNTLFSGSPKARARELLRFYLDDDVKAIFDISGGDSANQILPYLEYPVISEHLKPFMGISDLSVLLNAIYTRTATPTFHYQISNLVGQYRDEQQVLFQSLFMNGRQDDQRFLTFNYQWLRGETMKGVVVGGNIRCFLKLTGTPFMPDPTHKILFLESLGGGASRMASLLAQLDQSGYFASCSGIILGTFTEMAAQSQTPTIEELVLEITADYGLPVAKTGQLGHGEDGHCLPIGAFLSF